MVGPSPAGRRIPDPAWRAGVPRCRYHHQARRNLGIVCGHIDVVVAENFSKAMRLSEGDKMDVIIVVVIAVGACLVGWFLMR
jgi:hypothetical protein